MRRKYFSIATAISAAFLVAACTQTDVVDDMASMQAENPANNAISFSTYSAKKNSTRAGQAGSMVDSKLKNPKGEGGGFGVFAYYEAGKIYSEIRTEVAAPNFMYNQGVFASGDNWAYSPIKYWPNEFANGNVDFQETPAQGTANNGSVSFFAYAPYVENAAVAQGSVTENTWGIAGMTANNGSYSSIKQDQVYSDSDPRIKYILATNDAGKYVDLLWGTLEKNFSYDNAAGTSVLGVTGSTSGGTTYEQAITEGETVAADLTKQKITDKIPFVFKHALASIGGNTIKDESKDEDDTEIGVAEAGFTVKLDIDNSTTSAPSTSSTDGQREVFYSNGTTIKSESDYNELEEASKAGYEKYYRTIVTIKSISIETVVGDINLPTKTGSENSTTQAKSVIYDRGDFNLATGKWDVKEEVASGGSFNQSQTIEGNGESDDAANNKFVLNQKIAEYSNFPEAGTDLLSYFKANNPHTGVIESEDNIYENADVSPLLLLPGSEPIFKVTVEYVVRQYDTALEKGYTEVNNKISKYVVFPVVKQNTHYGLVMHLGLTSVKFTAEVSQWTEFGDEEGGSTGSTGRSDGLDVEDDFGTIHLPSNEISTESTQN